MSVSIVILIVIVLTATWAWWSSSKWRWVTANGIHRWAVISDLPQSDEAAALIGRVHARVIAFLRKLRDVYGIDAPDDVKPALAGSESPVAVQEIQPTDANKASDAVRADAPATKIPGAKSVSSVRVGEGEVAQRRRAAIDALLDGYNFERVYENDPRWSGTSYTIAKGSGLYLCVREKTPPYKLVDEDTLYFVVLHELAHIANYDNTGHTDKFWAVFKMLLHEAQRFGHYKPRDYGKYPVTYCGLRITYNPYYDDSLAVV